MCSEGCKQMDMLNLAQKSICNVACFSAGFEVCKFLNNACMKASESSGSICPCVQYMLLLVWDKEGYSCRESCTGGMRIAN